MGEEHMCIAKMLHVYFMYWMLYIMLLLFGKEKKCFRKKEKEGNVISLFFLFPGELSPLYMWSRVNIRVLWTTVLLWT